MEASGNCFDLALGSIFNGATSRAKRPTPSSVPVTTFSRPPTNLPVFVVIFLHAAVPAITPYVMHGFNDALVE